MYCPKCGNQVLDEAIICTKCGCLLPGKNIPETNKNSQNKTIYNNNQKTTNSKDLIFNVLFIILSIILISLLCSSKVIIDWYTTKKGEYIEIISSPFSCSDARQPLSILALLFLSFCLLIHIISLAVNGNKFEILKHIIRFLTVTFSLIAFIFNFTYCGSGGFNSLFGIILSGMMTFIELILLFEKIIKFNRERENNPQ